MMLGAPAAARTTASVAWPQSHAWRSTHHVATWGTHGAHAARQCTHAPTSQPMLSIPCSRIKAVVAHAAGRGAREPHQSPGGAEDVQRVGSRGTLARGADRAGHDGDTGAASSRSAPAAAYEVEEEEEGEEDGEEEAGGEGEVGEREEEFRTMMRQVVQVHTLHAIPNYRRPWEGGSDGESESTAFVVCTHRRLLMTTAGAVEFARKVEVERIGDPTPYPAQVVAVAADADVALITVPSPRFWRGMLAVEWGPLPLLRAPVRAAGFPIGGDSFAVTSGVVSRMESVEYSHAGRMLLALQVDAPLNNGSWGGPLYDEEGRVVGMAFQKFTTQTWMERYDEAGLDAYGGGEGAGDDGGEEDEGPPGGGYHDDGEGGAREHHHEEDGVENVGYAVPSLLLQHVMTDYARARARQDAQAAAAAEAASKQESSSTSQQQAQASGAGGKRGRGGKGARGGAQGRPNPTAATSPGTSAAGTSTTPGQPSPASLVSASMSGSSSSGSSSSSGGLLQLDGMPYLGLRWQAIENDAKAQYLGLGKDAKSGIYIGCVDPSASAAGAIQAGDVLLSLGGYVLARDGTVLLRPRQRVLFGYAVSSLYVGDTLEAEVLRDGVRQTVTLTLRNPTPILPVSLGAGPGGGRPAYFIISGLVLLQFSVPLMYTYEPPKSPYKRLRGWVPGYLGVQAVIEYGLPKRTGGEQIVVVSELLEGTPAADGYGAELGGPASMRRLTRVNGEEVLNMVHLAHLIVTATSSPTPPSTASSSSGVPGDSDSSSSSGSGSGGSHTSLEASTTGAAPAQAAAVLCLEFSDGSIMALDAATAREDTIQALSSHGITHAMSARLRAALGTSWPFEPEAGSGRQALQKRQQRRRLALRR